ncbi:MAG: hypothetical protein HZA03_10720 [Nitrospinae bacterium]|nr:hypothetical protein [Nitrospinota bacterium]
MKRYVVGFLMMCALAGAGYAQDFGIITDASGKIAAQRAGKKTFLEMGASIAPKDKLQISKGGAVTIVAYATCQEWLVAGAGEVAVENEKMVAGKGTSLKMGKKLPVCYKPGEIKGAGSHSMGGIALFANESKGPVPQMAGPQEFASTSGAAETDPAVKSLKDEYRRGKASNSTVIALMMYELNGNRVAAAKPYYDDLKKRAPQSAVVKEMAPRFEGGMD